MKTKNEFIITIKDYEKFKNFSENQEYLLIEHFKDTFLGLVTNSYKNSCYLYIEDNEARRINFIYEQLQLKGAINYTKDILSPKRGEFTGIIVTVHNPDLLFDIDNLLVDLSEDDKERSLNFLKALKIASLDEKSKKHSFVSPLHILKNIHELDVNTLQSTIQLEEIALQDNKHPLKNFLNSPLMEIRHSCLENELKARNKPQDQDVLNTIINLQKNLYKLESYIDADQTSLSEQTQHLFESTTERLNLIYNIFAKKNEIDQHSRDSHEIKEEKTWQSRVEKNSNPNTGWAASVKSTPQSTGSNMHK